MLLLQRPLGSHVEENIAYLINSGLTAKRIYESLCTQTVDLVFTAHPTQAIRDSIRTKYDALYRSLKDNHHSSMAKLDHLELHKSMYASMQAAW
jgi:phosphoenolpyruvate carboxylase